MDEIKIVILQRGWVVVGAFSKVGSDCILNNAYVIRRWGTERGLGQLALEGVQSNTILERTGIMQFDYLTVIATIHCNQTVWKRILREQ